MSPELKAKEMVSKHGHTDAIVQATQCLYLSDKIDYWQKVVSLIQGNFKK